MTGFVAAAAQYPIDWLDSWDAYAAKLERWLEQAAGQGARLAVFPEYGAMELASLDPARAGDLAASLDVVSALLPRVDALHAALSARFGLHVLAASAPCRLESGRVVNRARLFAPDGRSAHQDKLVMTRFEREQWGISPGDGLTLFRTGLGLIGVAICYDSEFPLIARALCAAGAQIILVPSCTDSLQGYWRVRISARARSLEGQCHVIQAPTVGDAGWSPAVDVNRGAAGIFGPPDGAFPDDGVVATGPLDRPQWIFGAIDPARVEHLRQDGAVLNLRHWAEQPGAGAPPAVRIADLT